VSTNPDPPKVVDLDPPFVFLIRDSKSGAVLFLGRALDLQAE
jgi:serine protease inhibitor